MKLDRIGCVLKLDHIGVHGSLLKLTQEFLLGRQQKVVIDGYGQVTFTLPQGENLHESIRVGKLLFTPEKEGVQIKRVYKIIIRNSTYGI